MAVLLTASLVHNLTLDLHDVIYYCVRALGNVIVRSVLRQINRSYDAHHQEHSGNESLVMINKRSPSNLLQAL